VVAAFSSMAMSGTHLANTGIANTYDTYAFHIGLWMMLVGVVVCISMAGIAIFRKQIAQHMGWQAVGFGFLLTAPLQRFDWILLAPFAGDLSFNEMNTVVNTLLFVQVTLLAYALFLLNRGSSPLHSKALSLSPFSQQGYLGGLLVIGITSIFWFSPILSANSLVDIPVLQRMIPEPALMHLASKVDSASIALFALASVALMLSVWTRLHALRKEQMESPLNDYAIWTSAAIAGAVSIFWAYKLGMPSHEHGVAGAGFFVLGVLLTLFLGLLAWKQGKKEWGKAVEWLQFLLLTSLAPAFFAFCLWALDRFNLVPAPYLSQAAGYELASIVAVFVPVVIGFILSIYSDETKRYRIS
jgi:hypothetical protein